MAVRDNLRLAVRQHIKTRFDEALSATVNDTYKAAPRDTGALARSVRNGQSRAVAAAALGAKIEASAEHARYTDEGTGLYGPRQQRIVPRSKPFLVFYWPRRPGGPGWVRLKSVRGQPARHWFIKPLPERWRRNLAAAFRHR